MKGILTFFLLTFSQSTIWQDIERRGLVTVIHTVNYAERLFDKYILGEDWTYWKLSRDADKQYDFIIVGSGAAGCVLANRLSEVSHWNVLLLEVGEPATHLMDIPFFASTFQNSKYDWADLMEVQPNVSTGLEDQRMAWPRGRGLGGTSNINYMIYTRGNKWDYDKWEAQGNPGWSYEDVLPYYMKSERARLEVADYRYHNTDGLLSVEDTYQSPIVEAFVNAGKELNLSRIDYNTPLHSFGVSTIQGTVKDGRRNNAARAFLYPAAHRKNLDVVTSAFVTKVLINATTQEAYGVEYEKRGGKYTVLANREVILSAGSFNSPQLLMLSGIGPKAHLTELGIPCLQDLPVGQNLHDHLTYPGLNFIVDPAVDTNLVNALAGLGEFLFNGTGRLTSLGLVEGVGYIKTDVASWPEDQPDIELLLIGGSLASDYGIFTRTGMRINDSVYNSILRPLHVKHTWSIFPMLLHPRSIGWLKLKSSDPHDRPLFYGNFFTDANGDDVKTFIAAIRFIQQVSKTTPFQKLGSRLYDNPMAGCQHLTYDSDEYWECALRSIALTLHHQVGTAKMGPEGDPTAVVNNHLQVHGIGRLRVADCSIIPHALSAHTNAPAVMVGEKAADFVKAFWGENTTA